MEPIKGKVISCLNLCVHADKSILRIVSGCGLFQSTTLQNPNAQALANKSRLSYSSHLHKPELLIDQPLHSSIFMGFRGGTRFFNTVGRIT
jgi:hypothetical protein